MSPQTVFAKIDKSVDTLNLDYDVIMMLPAKSWEQIVSILGLENEPIDPKEGRQLIDLYVNKFRLDTAEANRDQDEHDQDYKASIGWPRL